MSNLYSVAGVSKQAYFKSLKRAESKEVKMQKVVLNFINIRKHHKRMGCRKMMHVPGYHFPVGRDLAEQIGFANGFKLKRKRNPIKTTWSQRVEVFPNLIDGIVIDNINQVWQSDIFYLYIQDKIFYGIGIIDLYSRYILALHLSNNLSAEQNVKALQKALILRGKHSVKDCIFHSDRGSQYISKTHKAILHEHQMKISMCKTPQENAYAERLNGILKNDYFYPKECSSESLPRLAKTILRLYNYERPHQKLNNMTPVAFEHMIQNMVDNERPKMHIHQWNTVLSTEYQVVNKEKSSKKENLPNTKHP